MRSGYAAALTLLGTTLWGNVYAQSTVTVVPYAASTGTPVVEGAEDLTPCGMIAAALEAYAANGNKTTYTDIGQINPAAALIDADTALACLQSVPINITAAVELVQAYVPYMQFQSTLPYLADPPAGYPLPAVDLLTGLTDIENGLVAGNFTNEYDFQAAMWKLFHQAHDGHLSFHGDLLDRLIFLRQVYICSVSIDGISLPEVYSTKDLAINATGNATFTPSPIVTINGIPAATYLESVSFYASDAQDYDAMYNDMSTMRILSGISTNLWHLAGTIYPGSSDTFVFANGSSRTMQIYADILGDWSGITDGADVYERFCLPKNPTRRSTGLGMIVTDFDDEEKFVVAAPVHHVERRQSAASSLGAAFPEPVAVDSSGDGIAGFFVNETGYEDLAVLVIQTFNAQSLASIKSFQQTVQDFLAASVAAGKTKLIIDLQSNGGGSLDLVYDIYKQLFPKGEIDDARNSLAFPALDIIGQQYAAIISSNSSTAYQTLRQNIINVQGHNESFFNRAYEHVKQSTNYNYRNLLNATNQNFGSWADMFGPVDYYNSSFSELQQRNFTVDSIETGFDVTGFAGRANYTATAVQPFAAEDIVMLFNGFCHSSCATFGEVLRYNQGVKSIALGGRPQYAPMQGVGGTKGRQLFGQWHAQILTPMYIASLSMTPEQLSQYGAILDNYTTLPLERANGQPNVNAYNAIRASDPSRTPGQFTVDLADCRLWYTPPMSRDVTQLWTAAYAAWWMDGGATCVPGSTGNASTTTTTTTAATATAEVSVETVVVGMAAPAKPLTLLTLVTVNGVAVPLAGPASAATGGVTASLSAPDTLAIAVPGVAPISVGLGAPYASASNSTSLGAAVSVTVAGYTLPLAGNPASASTGGVSVALSGDVLTVVAGGETVEVVLGFVTFGGSGNATEGVARRSRRWGSGL